MNFPISAITAVLLAACFTADSASAQATKRDAPNVVVIRGATLIDGTGGPSVTNSAIVVRGDRISRVGSANSVPVPKGARIVDAHGKFIVPGLIDCHCHLEGIGFGDLAELPAEWQTPDRLKQLTRINARLDLMSGVTTVRDMGSTELLFAVRREIESGSIPGPRILAAGHQLVKKGPDAFMDPMFVEYADAAAARARVREQVALGADVIKIRLTPDRPLPSLEELQAIVKEAHGLKRRVAVHTWVPADDAVRLAVEAGVDSIEHNAPLRVKDDTLLQQMAQRHIAVVPGGGAYYFQRWWPWQPATALDAPEQRLFPAEILAIFPRVAEGLRAQTAQMEKQGWNRDEVQARFRREMQRARQAGVLLAFGTDCGGELIVHGQQYKAIYGESQMGSTPMQALLMATRDAARVLGRETELGTLEPGKAADLLIVDANPLQDLRNLGKVHTVMKAGRLYFPVQSPTAVSRSGHRSGGENGPTNEPGK